jgi:hypothetical protein
LLFRQYFFDLMLVLTSAGLISLLVTVLFIKETFMGLPAEPRSSGNTASGVLQNYRKVLKDRVFLIFVLSSLLTIFVEFNFGNYVVVRLTEEMSLQSVIQLENWRLQLDGLGMVGLLRTENTVLVVLLAAFSAGIFRRFADWKTMCAGCVCYVIGYSVMCYAACDIGRGHVCTGQTVLSRQYSPKRCTQFLYGRSFTGESGGFDFRRSGRDCRRRAAILGDGIGNIPLWCDWNIPPVPDHACIGRTQIYGAIKNKRLVLKQHRAAFFRLSVILFIRAHQKRK